MTRIGVFYDGGWFAFVSADSLPSGCKDLAEGTAVTFAGSARPAPGKRYPQACTVTPVADGD